MNTDRLPTGVRSPKYTAIKRPLRLKFDAKNFVPKYKNCFCGKNVQLEELHISKTGRDRIVYDGELVDGYRKVATIGLRGVQSVIPLQSNLGD